MKRLKHFFVFLYEHLEYIFAAILFVGVFYLAFTQGSYADPAVPRENLYTQKIFDQSYVHKVEVEIGNTDLENLLAEPRERVKYATSVTIDGEQFKDVAFSTRGNGSLMELSADAETDRYSYTLNFHKYSKGSYYGLDKLVLNNLFVDPSYLRNYLAFKLAAASQIDMPLTSFTELYINGELKGLYLAIEGVDHAYLNRTNSSPDAALFHPVPHSIDHNRVYEESKTTIAGEVTPWDADPGYGGTDFRYLGDEPEKYSAIFSNAATKYSQADEALIINAIRSLEPNELSVSPEQFWDIDSIINFFVTAAFAPNGDSYLGVTAQNYYIKISNGKLSLIPWDFDRAFYVSGLTESLDAKDGAVLWPIDSPLFSTIEDERPLWRLIVDNPEYLEQYHARIQQVLDDYLLSGKCRQDFDTAVELIRYYVYSDPTRFGTVEEFEDGVEYLRRFILFRADSLQKQLWGLLPRHRDDIDLENYQPLDLSAPIIAE